MTIANNEYSNSLKKSFCGGELYIVFLETPEVGLNEETLKAFLCIDDAEDYAEVLERTNDVGKPRIIPSFIE